MRRVVLSVLVPALFLIAGCGDDEGGTVTDEPAPAPSTSETSTPETSTPETDPSKTPSPSQGEPTGAVDFELVDILTETAAGGATAPTAIPLGDETTVVEFTSQFETDALRAKLMDIFRRTEVPDDKLMYAAVVAIGCDVPTEVIVSATDQGLVITGQKVPSPNQECFAAMTSVAVVLVDASVAG